MRQIPIVWMIVAGCASDDMIETFPDECTPGPTAHVVYPPPGAVVPAGRVDVRVQWSIIPDAYLNVFDDSGQMLVSSSEDVEGNAVVAHYEGLEGSSKFSIEAGWICINDNGTRYVTITAARSQFTTERREPALQGHF